MAERLKPGCLHGRVVKSLDVANFILTESVYEATSFLPEHAHENSFFCFVLKGIYTEKYGRNELVCQPSTVTFRASGETHENRFHKFDGRVFVVEIPPKWIDKLRGASLKLPNALEFTNPVLPKLSARLNYEFHLADNASFLAIEGLIYEMMAEAARQSSPFSEKNTPRWLKQARELIAEQFAENLTLEQIASQVGVHPVYFASVFKQKYGCTVGEFIRRRKIEYACREILKGELSLADISLEAGFADQSHFSKIFKLYTGLTPANYRKANC